MSNALIDSYKAITVAFSKNLDKVEYFYNAAKNKNTFVDFMRVYHRECLEGCHIGCPVIPSEELTRIAEILLDIEERAAAIDILKKYNTPVDSDHFDPEGRYSEEEKAKIKNAQAKALAKLEEVTPFYEQYESYESASGYAARGALEIFGATEFKRYENSKEGEEFYCGCFNVIREDNVYLNVDLRIEPGDNCLTVYFQDRDSNVFCYIINSDFFKKLDYC